MVLFYNGKLVKTIQYKNEKLQKRMSVKTEMVWTLARRRRKKKFLAIRSGQTSWRWTFLDFLFSPGCRYLHQLFLVFNFFCNANGKGWLPLPVNSVYLTALLPEISAMVLWSTKQKNGRKRCLLKFGNFDGYLFLIVLWNNSRLRSRSLSTVLCFASGMSDTSLSSERLSYYWLKTTIGTHGGLWV